MKRFLVLICAFLPISLCFSQEAIDLGRVVVTPLKTISSLRYHESQVVVIDEECLEDRGAYEVSEALNFIEGIDVIGAGQFQAQSLGVYIRGAQPRHTAYLFDGLKIYDPSNPSAFYMPYDFMTLGLEKIEAVKFPLSSMYGSSPLGGAINFIPKKPTQSPYIAINTGGGSHNTAQESLELGGQINGFSYLVNTTRIDTDGFSRAKEKNNNSENDNYQNTNITLNLNYSIPDDIEVGLSMKGIHSRSELDEDDNFDGIPEDDLDNIAWNNELFSTIHLKKRITPSIDYKIQGGFTNNYRKYKDGAEDNMQSWYKGQTYQFSNHFELRPFDSLTSIVGFDYTREKMDSYLFLNGSVSDFPKKTIHSKGFFIEQIFNPWEDLEIDFSYRNENHPYFDNHSVFKAGISYTLLENSDIYFSYGEGFKAPSLYQLYDPWRGNRNLAPEESKSWEVGVRHRFCDGFLASVTYFYSDFKNLIDFIFTNPACQQGSFVNVAKSKSRGIEAKIKATLFENLQLESGYSYLTGEQDFVDTDFVTVFHHSLIRVPKHKAFLKIGWEDEKFKAFFDCQYVGRRFDRIWVGTWPVNDLFVKMKPYFLGNLSLEYLVKEDTSVYLNIHNIFNRDYEQIKGFQEEKLSFYGGVKMKF